MLKMYSSYVPKSIIYTEKSHFSFRSGNMLTLLITSVKIKKNLIPSKYLNRIFFKKKSDIIL